MFCLKGFYLNSQNDKCHNLLSLFLFIIKVSPQIHTHTYIIEGENKMFTLLASVFTSIPDTRRLEFLATFTFLIHFSRHAAVYRQCWLLFGCVYHGLTKSCFFRNNRETGQLPIVITWLLSLSRCGLYIQLLQGSKNPSCFDQIFCIFQKHVCQSSSETNISLVNLNKFLILFSVYLSSLYFSEYFVLFL